MANMSHQYLVRCTEVAVNHLAASDIGSIADQLRSKGLVSEDVYSKSLLDDTTKNKARKLYEAVTNSVRAEPSHFEEFLKILNANSELQKLAKTLEKNLLDIKPEQKCYSRAMKKLDMSSDEIDNSKFGGLFVVGQQEVPLPLKSSSVRAKVHGYVVGLDSTLKYVNDGDMPVEVLFRFPVDESFAVVGMEALIEGRKIKAEIKKKVEANKDYQKAIASGHTAALVEEKSGDIFCISLGNLSVYAEAELHLKLVGELPIDAEGGVRFTLPAVLKPRYTPMGSINPLIPAGEAIKGQAPAVYDFKMAMKSEDVCDVTSPTHNISVNKDRDVINVSLSGGDTEPLKKDLVVLIGQKEPHAPKVMYELGDISKSQHSYMGAPAVMLSFFPKFNVKRTDCEFIFLVDRSGSMEGSYIKSASETLVLFLKSIPAGCIFNIIGFGSQYTSLFPESVLYDQQNLEYAMQHAESLQADLGGTELLSPLKHIFGQCHLPGFSRQIFVLTDGSVSNTLFCINEVKKNSNKCRVFTFGIGSGASTALVNGLAKAGAGTAEFIKEGERIQSKVIASLKRSLQPSVTDLEVNFDLPPGFQAFQAPANIPPLFNGDKVVIYGILKSSTASDTPLQFGVQGKASLKGQVSDESITHSISFNIPAPPLMGEDKLVSSTGFDLPVIHHLAAKSLLKDWKSGNGWGSTALTQEREQESTKLSIESNVICEHTAFVAIDTAQKKPIEGAIAIYDITSTMAEKAKFFSQSSNNAICGSSLKKKQQNATFEPREQPSLCNSCPRKERDLHLHSSQKCNSNSQRISGVWPAELLTTLISLQHADGFWLLEDISKKIVKKPEAKLQCPPDLSKEIWATIIALAYLECKHAEKKEEWELVAMKAEIWLSHQTLPFSIESLKLIAKHFCLYNFELDLSKKLHESKDITENNHAKLRDEITSDSHIRRIAEKITAWEVKYDLFHLTIHDIYDIKNGWNKDKPMLQSIDVLHAWKNRCLYPTYECLLEILVKGGFTDGITEIVTIINED